MWLKRQVDESVAQQIADLKIKGVYDRKEYKRIYPEGESVAHVVGFTNIENMGQAILPLRSYAMIAEIDGAKIIIDGHHRLMAQWLLGQQQAPVWKVTL